MSFRPVDFSTCILWLDAADVNGTGSNPAAGPVTQWTDKSGFGFNARSGTPASLSTSAINGLDIMAFNSNSPSVYSTATIATFNASQHEISIVYRPRGATANFGSIIRFQNGPAGGFVIYPWATSGPSRYLNFYNVGGSLSIFDNSVTGNVSVFSANINSNNQQVYKNSFLQGSSNNTLSNASPFTVLRIGGNNPLGENYNGDVCEICIFSTFLSSNQRWQLESYLASKWGLTSLLNPDNIYKYDFNLAATSSNVLANQEIIFTNTGLRSGVITLPSVSQWIGQSISFKDTSYNWQISTLTLSTSLGQTFEDGTTNKIFNERSGVIEIMGGPSNKWYFLGGVEFAAASISSMQVDGPLNVGTLSTMNLYTPSTLNFTDFTASQSFPMFSSNNYLGNPALYYLGAPLGGPLAGPLQLINF